MYFDQRVPRELVEFTCSHFKDEEAVLTRLAFSGLEAHRKSHEDYEEAIAEILAAAARGISLCRELVA